LTVGLLACATFLVVGVDSFHKKAGEGFFEKTGGSGGFVVLAETDVPLFQDLNDAEVWDDVPTPENRDKLANGRIYPLRLRAGDDASCLNLYQPLRPRLLGVPAALVQR